jgi:hypothetical protein
MPSKDGFIPQRKLNTGNSPFNVLSFLIQQALGRMNVATLVEVVAVRGGGTVAVGTVDVTPLVNQLDGSDAAIPHTVIYGIPYARIQGGTNAVICDPKKGDVGFCIFADRDISAVKASGARANPGSKRRFDMADGLYIGGWLNSLTPPVNYVMVSDAGIKLVGNVEVDGTLLVTGAVTGQSSAAFTSDVTGNGTSLHTHTHSGVTTGSGFTGAPV